MNTRVPKVMREIAEMCFFLCKIPAIEFGVYALKERRGEEYSKIVFR